MLHFGWIGRGADPPACWDLRHAGWSLCAGTEGVRAECQHVLLVDAAVLSSQQRIGLTDADRPAWRLLLLGVEAAGERAQLLTRGCAEALPCTTTLSELDARARRIDDMFGRLPRWRNVGPLVLDLFHRDARLDGQWMALHPREFGMLWRLSDHPGERVTRQQFLREVWRINHDPQTNSVEVHMSRLRSKLAAVDCAALVTTLPQGGYCLTLDATVQRGFMLSGAAHAALHTTTRAVARCEDKLDVYLRTLDFAPLQTVMQEG